MRAEQHGGACGLLRPLPNFNASSLAIGLSIVGALSDWVDACPRSSGRTRRVARPAARPAALS